ncbi:glycosyltransferase 8 domain-containing protein 2 isoform X3 [Scleropages formosus]|uniref:glycosyltransferase 8 domain-containing protein 2 isoform X3 n=1 Tax=Scleropages formosus TaxID=113540 RepID=UPI00087867FC|nr:glycosyltransferase 8 domain-containing protein 2 isoform X3 [Scleropages formosus]
MALLRRYVRASQRESHKPAPEGTEASEAVIPVVICAAQERMGGTMATINSIHSNTDASLFFYIITLRDAVQHVREYIGNSKLKGINYKIIEFNPMILKGRVRPDSSRPELLHPLNFVRFYLPLLIIKHRRVVYLDDDVIVQGDIQELYNMKLQPGHAAAFASDCDLPSTHEMVRSVGMQTTYMGFLDYRKREVRELGINPSDCSFNPGVFVADIEEWKRQKITLQLEKLMQQNFRDNLFSSAMAGGVATPPMLIAFYRKYTPINPLWHVRHLENSQKQAVCQENKNKAGALTPATRTLSCGKHNCCTGTAISSPGITLVFTRSSGRSGTSQTPQGSSHWFGPTPERKYSHTDSAVWRKESERLDSYKRELSF